MIDTDKGANGPKGPSDWNTATSQTNRMKMAFPVESMVAVRMD